MRAKETLCLGVILLVAWSAIARAQVQLLDPPNGFWLLGKERPLQAYGPTEGDATWHISQWQNPNDQLPPFSKERCGSATCYRSEEPDARILVLKPESGRPLRYTLTQSGAALECNLPNGKPREFDLFLGPNVKSDEPVYRNLPSPTAVQPTLSEIKTLRHRLLVKVAAITVKGGCKINQGQLLTAFVLRNDAVSPRQVFFYQLRLFKWPQQSNPNWWSPGRDIINKKGELAFRRFGFGDNLSAFGRVDLKVGEEAMLDLDLLPRLREIIGSGIHGLDRDLSHWRIMSNYHGQHIWGKVELSSEWSNFELVADKR